jgi:hypothetical protein
MNCGELVLQALSYRDSESFLWHFHPLFDAGEVQQGTLATIRSETN